MTSSGGRLRCASCGWSGEVFATLSIRPSLAKHLAECPANDNTRYVPRWTFENDVWECAWTTVDHDARWHPFTERGELMARA